MIEAETICAGMSHCGPPSSPLPRQKQVELAPKQADYWHPAVRLASSKSLQASLSCPSMSSFIEDLQSAGP